MATTDKQPIYKTTDNPNMIDIDGTGELMIRTPYGVIMLFANKEHETLKVTVQALAEQRNYSIPSDHKRWNMQIEAFQQDHIAVYIARFPYRGEEFNEG